MRGLCELSMFDRFSFKREREFSKKPEFIFFSFLSYFQSVQLRDQRGWSANVPWKSHFRSLLQQDNPIMGLVGFSPLSPSRSPWLAHFDQMVFRYDRKDPTSVAVSISPEASLMLGESSDHK